MKLTCLLVFTLVIPALRSGFAQNDSLTLLALKKEGQENSRVMEILSMLTDINGPRLTNSPGYRTAAAYAKRALDSWGVEDVRFDYWDEEFGRGWELKEFSLSSSTPTYSPIDSISEGVDSWYKRNIACRGGISRHCERSRP